MSIFKKQNNERNKIKIYASKPLMFIVIFTLFVGYGLFLFINIYSEARIQLLANPIYYIIVCFFTLGLCTLLIIVTCRRCFLVLEIDEHGVKTSLFHFFRRKAIAWEEITEIRYFEQIFPFIFISKSKVLANMSYDSIIKQKDVIQVSITPKVYKIIKTYYPKTIENLSDRKIKALNLDK